MTIVLDSTIRPELLRGRGALSNHVGRYEKQTRVLVDDGWDDGWRRSIDQEKCEGPKARNGFPSGRATIEDDGWDDGWRPEDAAPPPLRTEVVHDASRSIIARNKSPDISFD